MQGAINREITGKAGGVEWLQEFSQQTLQHGMVVFVLVYFLMSVLPAPRWPLTVAAGAAFGFVEGLILVLAVALAGSVVAFLVSRYVLRDRIRKLVKRRPKLKAVDEAMREGGWKAVALLQLSPAIPMLNYFLGASEVKLRAFVVGTGLTLIPSSLIYVGGGAGARFLGSLDSDAKWVAIAAGLAATIALTFWIGRLAGRRLGTG